MEHGADINIRNYNGHSALLNAVHYVRTDIIAYLLEHGADPSITDPQGRTAIQMIKAWGKSDGRRHDYIWEMIKCFRDHGITE